MKRICILAVTFLFAISLNAQKKIPASVQALVDMEENIKQYADAEILDIVGKMIRGDAIEA